MTSARHSSADTKATERTLDTVEPLQRMIENVPQRYADQALHARYAVHARAFFLSDFVSIENKGSKILIPKLKVATHSGRASTVDRVLQLRRFDRLHVMLTDCSANISQSCPSYSSDDRLNQDSFTQSSSLFKYENPGAVDTTQLGLRHWRLLK